MVCRVVVVVVVPGAGTTTAGGVVVVCCSVVVVLTTRSPEQPATRTPLARAAAAIRPRNANVLSVMARLLNGTVAGTRVAAPPATAVSGLLSDHGLPGDRRAARRAGPFLAPRAGLRAVRRGRPRRRPDGAAANTALVALGAVDHRTVALDGPLRLGRAVAARHRDE